MIDLALDVLRLALFFWCFYLWITTKDVTWVVVLSWLGLEYRIERLREELLERDGKR